MQKYATSTSGAFVDEFVIQPYQPGCLNGLSFAVKDCIDLKNKVTGFGNPTWLNTHPPAVAHAICIELLLSQGALCVGKTVTDEFTYSLVGENFFYGTPLNPRCPDRVPGGSSSGSASSVACGLVDFALGTDTGGSIRVPASNCGIYGYRPTHGRISTAGSIPLAPSLDTVSILAKNSATLKSVAFALIGVDFNQSIPVHKIVLLEDVLTACEPGICESTLDYLDQNCKGYSTIKLSDITSSEVTLAWLCDLYALLHSCEAWSVHGAWIESIKPELGPITDYNFNQIAKLAHRNMLQDGIKKREWFAKKVQNFLKDGTTLCFPTTPDIAPQKGMYSKRPEARTLGGYFQKLIGINAIAGLSRSPQITIPIGNVYDIPRGISFLAGQYQDELLFEH